ncbi:MAG: hypothetical protein JSS75_14405 [Bacteroidetes bacterium]|nr:hypothetical protein [Bacteroidota bacterium]
MKTNSIFRCLSLLAFVGAILSGCGSPNQASWYTTQPLTINGQDDDWDGRLEYHEKEKIGVGIANDGDNLYIVLKTIDRPTMLKLVRTGTTIWFDSTGGTKKIFGIRFPLGVEDIGITRGRRPDISAMEDDGAEIQSIRERFRETLREVEVIGPNPLDRKRLPVVSSFNTNGIKVGLSDSLGTLVYELVVPLHPSASAPLAIGTAVGKEIGVGIETTDMREQMRQRRPENDGGEMPRGGGMGGGMGGGIGGMGGGMRGA